MKKVIQTSKAPDAVGPYSQAVEANGILYISGQIALEPATGNLVGDTITEQTDQVMKNVVAVLEAAGYRSGDVVKTTCYLSDMSDFAGMNEVYSRYYPDNPPARAAFAVKELPKGARVEIEAIAIQ